MTEWAGPSSNGEVMKNLAPVVGAMRFRPCRQKASEAAATASRHQIVRACEVGLRWLSTALDKSRIAVWASARLLLECVSRSQLRVDATNCSTPRPEIIGDVSSRYQYPRIKLRGRHDATSCNAISVRCGAACNERSAASAGEEGEQRSGLRAFSIAAYVSVRPGEIILRFCYLFDTGGVQRSSQMFADRLCARFSWIHAPV